MSQWHIRDPVLSFLAYGGRVRQAAPAPAPVPAEEEPLELDALFRATATLPKLYWLPLTEEAAAARAAQAAKTLPPPPPVAKGGAA